MKTSKVGITLIKQFESLHDGDLSQIGLQPKMDPIGIWTEGWGRAMRDSKGNFIKGAKNKKLAYDRISMHTVEEADKALIQDLSVFESIVAKNIKISLNQNQFDALVSYVYNTGGSSTLYKLINNQATDFLIKTWIETHYIAGQGSPNPLPGLIKRRKAEANLYFKK